MAHIQEGIETSATLEKVYKHFYERGFCIFESDNPLYDFEIMLEDSSPQTAFEHDPDLLEPSDPITRGVIVCAYRSEAPNNLLAFHVASNLKTDEDVIIANVWINEGDQMVVDTTTARTLLFGNVDCKSEYRAPTITEDPDGFISEFLKTKATYILSRENYLVEPSDNPAFQLRISKDGVERLVYVMCVCGYESFDEIRAEAKRLPHIENACIFVNFINEDDSSVFGLYRIDELLDESIGEPESL